MGKALRTKTFECLCGMGRPSFLDTRLASEQPFDRLRSSTLRKLFRYLGGIEDHHKPLVIYESHTVSASR